MTLRIATSSAKFSAPSSAEFSRWRPPLPPGGRPQYAAPRAEIASSASGGRQTTPPSSSAQRSQSARLFPHSRLVETGGRRHPPAARRNVRSAHLRCRWRRPVPLGTRHGPSGRETFSVRALAEIGQNNSCCLVNLLLQQSRAGRAIPTSKDCPTRAAALTPGGRCLPALGMGHPGEKHSLSARLGKSYPINSSFIGLISS